MVNVSASKTAKYKRITAGIMAVMLMLVMLFSAFFVAAEAEHECHGEDCPICACIHMCENILHEISDKGAASAASVVLNIFTFLSVILLSACLLKESPVSRKVRMNN